MNSLCQKFESNLVDGATEQALHITDSEIGLLKGLPESKISSFREEAQKKEKEGYLVMPSRLQLEPMLEMAENREFRKRLLEAMNRVGTDKTESGNATTDNAPLIPQILKLRDERSKLLDLNYKDYTEFALENTMAGSVAAAEAKMNEVAGPAWNKFKKTMETLRDYAASKGEHEKLEPYDLPYWANLYRKDKYGYDAEKLGKYLSLDNVTRAFFKTAEDIFGVTIKENTSYARQYPDIKSYDVFDGKTGAPYGIIYADFYAREKKKDGAWMEKVQAKDESRPSIVSLNMCLPKPAEGVTPHLSMDDVGTIFHEGGHALHALLGTRTRHPSLQGAANAPSDYSEIHSMLLENWVDQPDRIEPFARDLMGGAAVPDELIHQLQAYNASRTFGSERPALRTILNSRQDFALHKNAASSEKPPAQIVRQDAKDTLVDYILPYPPTRFGHLFTSKLSDYASGYYGYFWSAVHSAAAYKTLKGLEPDARADRMKRFYGAGCSQEYGACFNELNGGPAKCDAYLESLGISTRVNRNGSKAAAQK